MQLGQPGGGSLTGGGGEQDLFSAFYFCQLWELMLASEAPLN